MTPSATFAEKLAAAAERNRSWLCVGLDPQPGRTPLDEIVPFTRAIIEATSDLVCAYKPQAAFFEAHGRAGWDALAATIAAVPDDVPVVLDAKRGDIAHVAEAYATACFDALGADAVTVNPYLGRDAVAPFLARPDKGAFILCRTSNAGGADLQAARRGRRAAVPARRVAGPGVERRASQRGARRGRDVPAGAGRRARSRPRAAHPAARHRGAGRRPGSVGSGGRRRRRAAGQRLAIGDLRRPTAPASRRPRARRPSACGPPINGAISSAPASD